MSKDQFIYLYARDCQRYRYNIASNLFETCYPAKRTLINMICCKQWGQWQALDSHLSYTLTESLKIELLTKQGYL